MHLIISEMGQRRRAGRGGSGCCAEKIPPAQFGFGLGGFFAVFFAHGCLLIVIEGKAATH